MPSREAMIATAEAYAREIGWTEVVTVDTGPAVEMLLSAPGASEQVVAAPLATIRKALKDWGGPELYPATEEYDVDAEAVEQECFDTILAGLEYDFETAEVEAGDAEETVYIEQAETPEELEVALKEARMEPRPTDHVGVEGLHEDISPTHYERPGLKERYRALNGEGDTSPDGIPRPEQMLAPAPEEEEELRMPGKIVARRGEDEMRFGFAIRPQVKAALEKDGWSFAYVVAAAKGDSTVAVERSGQVTIQNVNGRLINSAGGKLLVSKAGRSFEAKSVSVAYAQRGWHITAAS